MTASRRSGADEARQQVVLDLARELPLAGAVAVGDEDLPVVAHHHLIRDARAVGDSAGASSRRGVRLIARLRAGRRPDHQAVLRPGARDVGERLAVGRQRRRGAGDDRHLARRQIDDRERRRLTRGAGPSRPAAPAVRPPALPRLPAPCPSRLVPPPAADRPPQRILTSGST